MDGIKEEPYAVRTMPDGKRIEFYKIRSDLSHLSEVDRTFGKFPEKVRFWVIPETQESGEVGASQTPKDVIESYLETLELEKEIGLNE
jgi:hypothetical protein